MPLTRMAAPARLLAALGAVALTLAGCGAALPEPSLHDIAQVQAALEQAVRADGSRHATAYCPTDVPAIKGQVFSCVVEIRGSAPAVYRVTVETPQGVVAYIRMR
jgi:anti-sigma factor RsiW